MPDAFRHVRRAASRVVTRRSTGLAATVAALLVTAPAALGATRTATSPSTGMSATLDGPTLTVTTGAKVSTTFLRSVQGKTVTVACLNGAEDLVKLVDEESLVPSAPFDFGIVGGPALWAGGATSLSYTLPRDISERADGCVVGRDLELAASFGFNALATGLLGEGLGTQRLALAHGAAKAIARERDDRRFPSPRALARAIAAAEPQMDVAFARTVRRATRNDVVYVIGSGTSFKRVRLSHRELDGQPTILDGRRRGTPDLEEGESSIPVPPPGEDDQGRGRPGR